MKLFDEDHQDRVFLESAKSYITGIIVAGVVIGYQEYGLIMAMLAGGVALPFQSTMYELLERVYERPSQ